MDAIIDRVMKAHTLMVNLTAEEADDARQRLREYLGQHQGSEHDLTVQAMKLLRGDRRGRTRSPSTSQRQRSSA